MDFGKALEALKDEKKVKRSVWSEEVHLFYDQDRSLIIDTWTNQLYDPTQPDVLAGDWEIVSAAPDVTAEEVLSEYETWILKAIHESYTTTNFFNPYYVKCFLELNRLSASKLKTPEKCDVKYIDRNHAVVNTESGKSIIVHLF